jgi:hypothetical protein
MLPSGKIMGTNNLSRHNSELEVKTHLRRCEGLGIKYRTGIRRSYSNRHEIIELAKVAASAKARYISHIRSEDVSMADAIDEIIQIGR